jgi:hypothetical protein
VQASNSFHDLISSCLHSTNQSLQLPGQPTSRRLVSAWSTSSCARALLQASAGKPSARQPASARVDPAPLRPAAPGQRSRRSPAASPSDPGSHARRAGLQQPARLGKRALGRFSRAQAHQQTAPPPAATGQLSTAAWAASSTAPAQAPPGPVPRHRPRSAPFRPISGRSGPVDLFPPVFFSFQKTTISCKYRI